VALQGTVVGERTAERLRIEVWSDIACPWCYLGKHRLEKAIGQSPHAGSIDLVFRSFELDPTSPSEARPLMEYLAAKMGLTPAGAAQMDSRVGDMARAEGLPYTSDRVHANSFDVHRVLHLANADGSGNALLSRLYLDLFGGKANIYDRTYLIDTAAEHGIAREQVAAVLDGDEFAAAVRRDVAEAARLGVRGVPFAVLDGRYGIPGALDVDGYARGIEQAWGSR
jgi:predicted DsbA family dithiol-disulfide isomerase